MRISVTDRCTYCMPKEVFGADYQFLPHAELLTFEEIVRLAKICRDHGIEKIRLTGGEPPLRKGLEACLGLMLGVLTLGIWFVVTGIYMSIMIVP